MESEVAAWLRDNDLLCLDAVLRDAGYDDLPDLRALCGDAPALCSLVPSAAVRMKLRRLMLQKAHPYYNVTSPRPPLSACLDAEGDVQPLPPRSWPTLAPAFASRRPSSSGSSRDSAGELPLRTQRQRHRPQLEQQRQDYYVDCPSSVATGSPRPAAAAASAAALGESCLLLPGDDDDVPPPSPPGPGTAAIFNHASGLRRAPLPSVYASAAPAFKGSTRQPYSSHAAPEAPLAIRAPAPLASQSLDGRRVHALRAAHRTLTSPAASPLARLPRAPHQPSSAAARTTSSTRAARQHRSLLDHPGNSAHAPPSPPASPPSASLSLPPSRHTSRPRRPSTGSAGAAPATTRRRNSTMSPPAPVRARGADGGAAKAANTATTPSARRRTAVSPEAPAKPGLPAAKLAKARSGGARSPPPPVDARRGGGEAGGGGSGGGGTVLENGYKATLVLEGGRRVASFGWVPRDDDSLHFISDAGTTVVKLASVRTVHADERRCGCTLQLHDGRTVAFEVHEASYHAALLHKLRGLLGRSVHVGRGADRPSPPSPSLAIPSPLAGLDCP